MMIIIIITVGIIDHFCARIRHEIHIKKGFRLSLFHPFPNPVNLMNKKDAGLRYVSNDFMTNTSLRERFSIAGKNYSMASRIIADAMDKKNGQAA